jgi:hypothetical protein
MSNLTPTTLSLNDYKVWGTSTLVWSTADVFFGVNASATFTIADGLVPDLVAVRDPSDATLIALNVTNTGGPEARYWRSDEVMGNFASLADVAPASDYSYVDDPVDADRDYKYKAAFVASGTINGLSVEVVGQRSPARYVISESSTL